MFYFLKTQWAHFRALWFSFPSTQAFCKLSCHAEYWHRLPLSICHDGSLPLLKCDKKTILEHECQQNADMVFNSAFLTLLFGQDAMMSVADLIFGRGCATLNGAVLSYQLCIWLILFCSVLIKMWITISTVKGAYFNKGAWITGNAVSEFGILLYFNLQYSKMLSLCFQLHFVHLRSIWQRGIQFYIQTLISGAGEMGRWIKEFSVQVWGSKFNPQKPQAKLSFFVLIVLPQHSRGQKKNQTAKIGW